MTNGEGQVIVALLLMGQRARTIEVGAHGRAEHGPKVAGVIGAVVVANRRINNHQPCSRRNRSCTSSVRHAGFWVLPASGMVLSAHGWPLMGRNSGCGW